MQTEITRQEPGPSTSINLAFFSFLQCLWKLLLRHTERGLSQALSADVS